jgi:hypothetical protein
MASLYLDFDKKMSDLPDDHWTNIAHLPYFKYIQRPEAETLINGTINKYIIRSCGDRTEYINGVPNPNLFVISYSMEDETHPGLIVKKHTKIVRDPQLGLRFHTLIKQLHYTFFPTMKELIANSGRLSILTPLLL